MHYDRLDETPKGDSPSHIGQAPVPEIEPEKNPYFWSRVWRTPRGWKFSLSLNATTALNILFLNIAVAIWASTKDTTGSDDAALRTIYEGSCSKASRLNTLIHLLINILSSLLLAASNYAMQCLSAPTRDDIEQHHSKGRWLDIGVPSFHNLRVIPRNRTIPWYLLIISSLPLHLLYNSAIFSSLTARSYTVYSVRDIPSGSIFSQNFTSFKEERKGASQYDDYDTLEGLWNLGTADKLEKLSPIDCINEYATAFQTARSNLLLVTDGGSNKTNQGIPMREEYSHYLPDRYDCLVQVYEWMCVTQKPGEYCEKPCRNSIPEIKRNADNWRPFGDRVKYCLSQPEPQTCKLHFSTWIMTVVIVTNAIKVAVMLWLTFRHPPELLLTIGDAIKSFLASPDAHSTNSCLVTAEDVKRSVEGGGKEALDGSWTGPRPWTPVRRRWATAVSRRRWKSSIFLYTALLITSLAFLGRGIAAIVGPKSFSVLWNLGFGAASETALITFSYLRGDPAREMIWVAICANIPQLLFSFLYFQYNALFTGMLAAREWSTFGRKRRGVRVSCNLQGKQRERYFLQLPYRWGLPLLFMSILVHWMLSQSIFIVSVVSIDSYGDDFFSTCGFSPMAIICVILASFVMVSAVVLTGFQRLPTTMPVVGSCSLAIAAACHHDEGIPQPDAAVAEVMWGVTRGPDQEEDRPGHCGFSSDGVEEPEAGAAYA
ncbi:hypothetical protein B0T10DRAFT_603888 [Thelonectria olida]|uniref:DUF6536 domain-containing protein n=1 Tax=Thelonectria olida TaxID=1576542 RepID=A0A9P8WB85_9HYPO|nr:hypothetical protein B0T10DRAFT_603888 [Thelonectria olida]